MFTKLSQRSTSWWICVMVTSVLSACVLTVLVYPAYAALCSAECKRAQCGDPPIACGSCNDDLGPENSNKDWRFTANVTAYNHWRSGNKCLGQVNTYHTSWVYNDSASSKTITWKYRALFMQEPEDFDNRCTPQEAVNENPGSFVVPPHDSRTNTYAVSQTYTLGPFDVVCKYKALAVTEFTFQNGNGGDTPPCLGPKFTACP